MKSPFWFTTYLDMSTSYDGIGELVTQAAGSLMARGAFPSTRTVSQTAVQLASLVSPLAEPTIAPHKCGRPSVLQCFEKACRTVDDGAVAGTVDGATGFSTRVFRRHHAAISRDG